MTVLRGWLPYYINGDVGVFVVASSVLCYLYNHKIDNLGSSTKTILNLLMNQKNSKNHNHNSSSSSTSTNSSDNNNNNNTNSSHSTSLGCMVWDILVSLRAFGIGYGIRGSISLLSGLILKKMYKKPGQLLLESFGTKSSAAQFGLFLGLLVLGWTGIRCLLFHLTKKRDSNRGDTNNNNNNNNNNNSNSNAGRDKPIYSLLAGAIGGLAILFFRSTEMSMFFFVKVISYATPPPILL